MLNVSLFSLYCYGSIKSMINSRQTFQQKNDILGPKHVATHFKPLVGDTTLKSKNQCMVLSIPRKVKGGKGYTYHDAG